MTMMRANRTLTLTAVLRSPELRNDVAAAIDAAPGVVGRVQQGKLVEALAGATLTGSDLVLVDLDLETADDLEALERLVEAFGADRVLVPYAGEALDRAWEAIGEELGLLADSLSPTSYPDEWLPADAPALLRQYASDSGQDSPGWRFMHWWTAVSAAARRLCSSSILTPLKASASGMFGVNM